MTTKSDITEKITTALAEYLKRDPGSIKPDYHLRDDLGLDSMAVIELVYRIEETFNLQIPDQDLAGLACVQDVVNYVDGRLSADGSRAATSAGVSTQRATQTASARQADVRKTAGSKTGASQAAAAKSSSKHQKKRS